MKKLVLIMLGCLVAGLALALGTNTTTKIVNINALQDDWTDFRFRWNGYDTQFVSFTITTNSTGAGYSLEAGTLAAFQMSKQVSGGTNIIYVNKGVASCAIATSNVTFSILHTNLPAAGVYKAELLLMDSATNVVRTAARGQILIRQSLY